MTAVGVSFPYRLTCIPKGCRNLQDLLVWGWTTAAIRTVSAHEAGAAFRLRFPSDRMLRYVWPKKMANHPDRLKAATVDLLRYGDAIWWPWLHRSGFSRTRYDIGSPTRLFDELAEGEADLLGMSPTPTWRANIAARPEVRSIVEDDCDVATAMVQRKVFENFLICGDRVYVRGGDPVYVRNARGHRRFWEIEVASVGADRSVDPRPTGIDDPPFGHMDWGVQRAFRDGALWRADMRDLAKSATHPMQERIPTIEVIGAEPPADHTLAAVIDAIFREALDLTRTYGSLDDLEELLEPGIEVTGDADTTRRRRTALRDFFGAATEAGARLAEVRKQFLRFERAVPDTERLAPEDEQALGSLGDG